MIEPGILLQTLIPCIPQHYTHHQNLWPIPTPVPVTPILSPGRLDKDFIKCLSPDTPTPHGSLDILNKRISILGKVVRGICHQLLLSIFSGTGAYLC
jgi:hypothetical protein